MGLDTVTFTERERVALRVYRELIKNFSSKERFVRVQIERECLFREKGREKKDRAC